MELALVIPFSVLLYSISLAIVVAIVGGVITSAADEQASSKRADIRVANETTQLNAQIEFNKANPTEAMSLQRGW